MLSKRVPRVRMPAMWRVPEALLEQAQDDATIGAIRDMERAGIDIISDGEIRRESYSNRFATALEGVDVDRPALITDRYGNQTQVPRVVARVRRARPVELRDMQFLRRHTDRPAKITLPGPFTMAQQARNEFYRDVEELAMDLAAAVNMEAHELQAAGADVIQLDEPWLRNDPEGAKRYAVPVINRALAGLTVPTALHLCFGYAAVVKHQKPTGYSFLPQLAGTTAQQISIEAAQPKLDLGVLAELSGKSVMLGVIDLGDPAVGVSILRGAGPAFSSGYDLSADNSVNQPYYSPGGPGQWARHVVDGWFTIWDLAKPVIAQVHGYCLAGGSELAACCDLVYVAEDARIGYPPTRLMSAPDNQFHPWLMGMRTAMDMFITADAITGTESAAL